MSRSALTHRLFRGLLLPSLALATAAPTPCQCATTWLPGDPVPGAYGDVLAVTEWDPDGAGPLPPHTVVAGNWLPAAGSVPCNSIACFDPTTRRWSALGAGVNFYVDALAALPSGELVATGGFTTAGQAPAAFIARWDGTAWSPLGSGLDAPGHALLVLPNGDLLVGGSFTTAGGIWSPGLARWNGASWVAMTASFQGNEVRSLYRSTNGDVLVGGSFTAIDGVAAADLARWNGSTWSDVAGGPGGAVQAVVELANGDLAAVGDFSFTYPGVFYAAVARFVAATSTWSLLGDGRPGLRGNLRAAAATLPNGELVVTGDASSYDHIQRWDGAGWTGLGAGLGGSGSSLITGQGQGLYATGAGELLAVGRFARAGDVAAFGVARWDGADWNALAAAGNTTLNGPVHDLARGPTGELVAAGAFTHAGDTRVDHVARRVGGAWLPLGAGCDQPVDAVVVRPDGEVVVAGGFDGAGGVPADGLAAWDGLAWRAIGTPSPASAFRPFEALALTPTGDVLLAGRFDSIDGVTANGIARWDGATWTSLGGGLATGTERVRAIAVTDDGWIAAAGNFPGRVAIWDGISWTPVGVGQSASIAALAWLPDGRLAAAGGSLFGGASTVQAWDGAGWTPLGAITDDVAALLVLPGGDLLAAGSFVAVGGVPMARIARFDGLAWSGIGAGITDGARALAIDDLGRPVVGGHFHGAGGSVSAFVAGLTSSCPAGRQFAGAGCGGATTFAEAPWIGSTWRAHVSGLQGDALAVLVNGFQPIALNLAGVLPGAAPGCTLFAQPDYVVGVVTASGAADFTARIPADPSLVGATFWHQTLAMALTAGFAVTTDDAQRLTIGAF